jgi:hypothetical protein
VTVLKKLENITDYKEKEIYKTMGKTIKLKESELIKLIEDTAKKQILLNAKSKDMNFDNKINKVTKRFSKIINRVSESTPNERLEAIRKETIKLREAGYSYLIIGESFKLSCNSLNEGFLDGANALKSWIGAAFDGASDTAKEYAYDWVLGMFGIPDGKFKDALAVTLGEVDIADLPKLMTDCKFTAHVVADGCVEYVIRLIMQDVAGVGGVDAGAGVLGKIIGNTVEKQLEQTEVHQELMASVENLICNSDNSLKSIEDISKGVMAGELTSGGSGKEGSMSSILGL